MARNAKKLQSKSKTHEVIQVNTNQYEVKSGSSSSLYTVTVRESGATCTCKWAQYRKTSDTRSGCSHTISVYKFIEAENDRQVSAWGSDADVARQHRTSFGIGDGITLTTRGA